MKKRNILEKFILQSIHQEKMGGGNIYACYDDQKYLRLLRIIDTSNVSVAEKNFLIHAASRFIEFNYESIA